MMSIIHMCMLFQNPKMFNFVIIYEKEMNKRTLISGWRHQTLFTILCGTNIMEAKWLQKSFMLTWTVQKGLDEMFPRIHPELLPVSLTCANGVTMRSSPWLQENGQSQKISSVTYTPQVHSQRKWWLSKRMFIMLHAFVITNKPYH